MKNQNSEKIAKAIVERLFYREGKSYWDYAQEIAQIKDDADYSDDEKWHGPTVLDSWCRESLIDLLVPIIKKELESIDSFAETNFLQQRLRERTEASVAAGIRDMKKIHSLEERIRELELLNTKRK